MMIITGLYAALSALLIFILTANVIRYRRSQKIGIGDGGNKELNVAMRAHGNATEQIPMLIILLAIAELNGVSAIILHSCGASLIVGRALHAWGLISAKGGVSFGRFYGMVITLLTTLALVVINLLQVLPKLFA